MNMTQAKIEIEKLQERVTTLEELPKLLTEAITILSERTDKSIMVLIDKLVECKVIAYDKPEPYGIDRIKEELGL